MRIGKDRKIAIIVATLLLLVIGIIVMQKNVPVQDYAVTEIQQEPPVGYLSAEYLQYFDVITGTFEIAYTVVLDDQMVETVPMMIPITITEHISPNVKPPFEMPVFKSLNGDIYVNGAFDYFADGYHLPVQPIVWYSDLKTKAALTEHGYFVERLTPYTLYFPMVHK